LFFWAPILLLAIVGLLLLRGAARALLLPFLVFLGLHLYVVSSWSMWWYGGAFGHRAFVEAMGLFAVGLAALHDRLPSGRRPWLYGVAGCLILLSVFQMLQYWTHVFPYDDVTWGFYKDHFFTMPTW
jgi:hypothetical protein